MEKINFLLLFRFCCHDSTTFRVFSKEYSVTEHFNAPLSLKLGILFFKNMHYQALVEKIK